MACTAATGSPVIRLSELRWVPEASTTGVVPLRVAVGAVISPRGTVESYRPLVTYLSRQLGRPIELVQRRTYTETNALIERGEVDVAFVCTSAYVAGHDAFGMELLVAPEVRGRAVYQSLLIVPTASPAWRMADLRGKVFAFPDPMSFSGRVYPTVLVDALGETPASFFERTFFTYSHDSALRAVVAGLADGAAIDSLVFDMTLAREPELGQHLRVIERSPPFGIPPVVVGPQVRPQLRATLQELLLTMDEDPTGEGQRVLEGLGIDRYVIVDDAQYASARRLIQLVGPLRP
jgi:phosphonate transport system substrate-binding protein